MLTLYTRDDCAYCVRAKQYLQSLGIEFREIDVVQEPQAMEFLRSQGHRTIPQIYWDGRLFVSGGWQGLREMSRDDILTAIEILETRSLGTL